MRAILALSLIVCALSMCGPIAAEPAGLDEEITVECTGERADVFIARMFEGSGLSFSVDHQLSELVVPPMTFRAMPIRKALDVLANSLGIIYRADGDIILISKSPDAKAPTGRGRVGDWAKLVDIEVKDMTLSEAIGSLLRGTGINYTADAGVSQLRANAVLKNVPVEVALKSLLKAAGATYRIEGDIVHISTNTDGPIMTQVGNLRIANLAPGAPDQKIVSRAVPLRNLNPNEAATLAAQSNVRMMTTNNNQSIITGSEAEVQQAADLLTALDSPQLAQSVRIKLEAKITHEAKGEAPTNYELSSESTGVEGSAIPVNNATCALIMESKKKDADTQLPPAQWSLTGQFTPTLLNNDSKSRKLTISLNGSLSLTLTVPYAESVSTVVGENVVKQDIARFINISKVFPVAWAVEPGRPTVIAGGTDSADTGRVDYSVTATLTMGEMVVVQPPVAPDPPKSW